MKKSMNEMEIISDFFIEDDCSGLKFSYRDHWNVISKSEISF